MQVYPTPSRSEQNRGIFIYHSLRWEPYFILFLSFMREVVSCCKGEWKAIQEKSLSKSENEGFIIQKTPNPWNRYFEPQHFFFLTPHFTLTFTILLIRATFFFFNTNIYFIYFYFNYNTPEKREKVLRKQNVGLVLAGMGDDGFQNYCLVVIVIW